MPVFPGLPSFSGVSRSAVRAVAFVSAGAAVAVTAALNPLAFAVGTTSGQLSVETSRPPVTSRPVSTSRPPTTSNPAPTPPGLPQDPNRPTVTMTLTQIPPGGFPPGNLPSGPTLPPWSPTYSSGAQPGVPTVTGAPLPTDMPTSAPAPTMTSASPTSAKPTSAKPTSQRPTSNRPTSNRPTSQRP